MRDGSITHDELKRVISYDPLKGDFTWKIGKPGVSVGKLAGSKGGIGYWRVKINRRAYLAHRLAWFYMTGEWPADQIDHIDGNKLNNAFANLRECSGYENSQNIRRYPNNTSGFVGVSKSKEGRWKASIRLQGARTHLGTFLTKEEAATAYLKAKETLHVFQPNLVVIKTVYKEAA